jgi:O-antigen/teichoic acid export membrane protein
VSFSKAQFGYAPLLLCATALLFFKNIVYAKFLPVAGFGSLNQAVFLAGAFVNLAGGGLPLLGHKMLPQYYARNDRESAAGLNASAIGAYIFATVAAAALLLVAWLLDFTSSPAWWLALLAYAGAQYIFALKLINIKSRLQFARYARLSVLRALSLIVFGVLTAVIVKSAAAVLVVEGCVTLVMLLPETDRIRTRLSRRRWTLTTDEWSWLRLNLRAALRLLWLNGVFVVLFGLDRWAGLSLLDDHSFGIYAIGLTVITVFESAQSIVNVAVYPLMARMFSRGAVNQAFRLASTATLVVAVTTTVLYLPFSRLLDVLLLEYLPAYGAASTVLKISVLAGALRLADFFCTFAILSDRENRLTSMFAAEIVGIVITLVLLKAVFGVRFDPSRMAYIALAVALVTLATNFTVAAHAVRHFRRRVPLMSESTE